MRHALLALAALSLAATAHAGIIYVKKGATGANNGTSWADAFAELRDALPASTLNDELWIAQGTYTPATSNDSFVVNGRKLYGGFNGTETLLDQRNWATYPTILSGDILGDDVGFGGADNCKHVVHSQGQSSAVLDGLVIEGGVALGALADGQGAGIYCDNSDFGTGPVLINTIVRRNIARRGAGMFVHNGPSEVTGCTFYGNRAQGQGAADGGAGIYSEIGGGVFISLTTFTDNTQVQSGSGIASAIQFSFMYTFIVQDCIIWGNSQPSVSAPGWLYNCCVDFAGCGLVPFVVANRP